MRRWLAVGGLLLFLSLPAILTMLPPLPWWGPPAATMTISSETEPVALPEPAADRREQIFLDMWNTVERGYIYFDRRDVDWEAVRVKYLPLAREAASDADFFHLLQLAIAELEDTHTSMVEMTAPGRPAIWVEPVGEQIVIAQVDPDSDAEQAGLKPGMVLLEVDGRPTTEAWARAMAIRTASTEAGRKFGAALRILRGEAGTYVAVVAGFPGEPPVRVALERAVSPAPPVPDFVQKELPGGITYIRIGTMMDQEVLDLAIAALRDVAKVPPRGLIIDVRYNGGGQWHYAAALSEPFFSEPVILGIVKNHLTNIGEVLLSQRAPNPYPGPVIVLTNPACASACDFFATYMKQEARAILVGENPAGAGISTDEVSLILDYKLNMSVHLETLDSQSRPIEKNPAQVDHLVTPTVADLAAGRDTALEKALSLLAAP